MAWFMGIDIGSGTSKGVIAQEEELSAYHILPSGSNYKATSEKLIHELLAKAKLTLEDITHTVATGCGASNITFSFSNQWVVDMRCCTRGVKKIYPSARTIISVGNQSSQAIRVSTEGEVANFVVSERCATGSGRFLDIMANVLRIDLKDIGPLSLRSKNPVSFTTACAVFGESEALSRIAEGTPKEDILAGVHRALADKISVLVDRITLEKDCIIIGGGGLNVGLVHSLEEKLEMPIVVPPHPQIITAWGAAIIASQSFYHRSQEPNNHQSS